jgi:peptidoglycan/LPS O-acetylase OafA/YrhL
MTQMIATVAEEATSTTSRIDRSSSFYRPELDVLRFFAFLSVFIFHVADHPAEFFVARHVPLWIARLASGLFSAGSRGVDLFFVLSAYLITELLLREKEQRGSLDVKSFYVRRILRIWPLYYFFVPLAALVPFLNPSGAFSLRYVIPFLLLAGNWSTIIFGPTGSVAEPLWSVAVEEQFYLAWPPIVARLSPRQITIAAGVMVLLANVARLVAITMHATGWQIWANTLTHLDAMAGGILLAVLLGGRIAPLSLWGRLGLMSLGAAAIAATSYFTELHVAVSAAAVLVGYPVVALSCTAIVFAGVGIQLRAPVLQYLGKISYGLYVYHLTCIRITDRMLNFRWGVVGIGGRGLVALCMTIVVSAASYRFLETPFLKLKHRFTHVESRPV